jgi:hypothetical protein
MIWATVGVQDLMEAYDEGGEKSPDHLNVTNRR